LARAWAPRLTPQDRQGYRPHVTVLNKASAARARTLLDDLWSAWAPLAGRADAVLLWRYRGGPWEPAGAFPFDVPAPHSCLLRSRV
jgi:hypothetical protein